MMARWWRDIRRAWAEAQRDGGDDPWAGVPVPTLGAVRGFHLPDEQSAAFVLVTLCLSVDGELLTIIIDGHPYLVRLEDMRRGLREAELLANVRRADG